MSFLENWNADELKRIFKFGITGVMNTLVDYLVFALLANLLGVNAYIAQIFSYAAGMLNSYLVNRSWTFRSKDRFFSLQMVKFIVTNVSVLAISLLLLKLFTTYLGFGLLFSKLLTTCVTMVLNFVISRLWVFR